MLSAQVVGTGEITSTAGRSKALRASEECKCITFRKAFQRIDCKTCIT